MLLACTVQYTALKTSFNQAALSCTCPQEKAITDFQDRLQLLWDKINSAAALPGTFSDLKYATAQLMTRLFQFEGVGLVMIPLVDMGNHR